jgi:hypothetical protein
MLGTTHNNVGRLQMHSDSLAFHPDAGLFRHVVG